MALPFVGGRIAVYIDRAGFNSTLEWNAMQDVVSKARIED